MIRRKFVITLAAILLAIGVIVLGLYFWASSGDPVYAKPVGKLVIGDNKAYDKAIVQYCETSWAPGGTCQAHVLGSDDRYIYAQLHWDGAGDGANYGGDDGRYTYTARPLRVTGQTLVSDGDSNPSTTDLYPKQVYDASRDQGAWSSWLQN